MKSHSESIYSKKMQFTNEKQKHSWPGNDVDNCSVYTFHRICFFSFSMRTVCTGIYQASGSDQCSLYKSHTLANDSCQIKCQMYTIFHLFVDIYGSSKLTQH